MQLKKCPDGSSPPGPENLVMQILPGLQALFFPDTIDEYLFDFDPRKSAQDFRSGPFFVKIGKVFPLQPSYPAFPEEPEKSKVLQRLHPAGQTASAEYRTK
jgi:hypothetical protein